MPHYTFLLKNKKMKNIFTLFFLLFVGNAAALDLLHLGKFCLDSRAAPTESGLPLFLYPCHAKERQRWEFTTLDSSRVLIQMWPHACIANVKGSVVVRLCQFDENEVWFVENNIKGGTYRQGDYCLGVQTIKQGAKIELLPCENKADSVSPTQFWTVTNALDFWLQKTRPRERALQPGELRNGW